MTRTLLPCAQEHAASEPNPNPALAGGMHSFWAPLPEGPFDFIEADPNWRYKGWGSHKDTKNTRSPDRHYKTATIEQIMALPVADIAAKHSHLALWITGNLVVQGEHVRIMRAWGFKPSSVGWVWVKVNRSAWQGRFFSGLDDMKDIFMGLGKTTRQNAEFVMLGRRGSPKRFDTGNRQVILAPRRQHSRKPDEFYDRARAYAGPDARMVSLFSRQPREGWTVWGDEADKFEDGK